jgi:hypothetical protein
MDTKIDELDKKMPELGIREYMEKVDSEFTERPYIPLDEVWKKGLQDIFDDMEDW